MIYSVSLFGFKVMITLCEIMYLEVSLTFIGWNYLAVLHCYICFVKHAAWTVNRQAHGNWHTTMTKNQVKASTNAKTIVKLHILSPIYYTMNNFD
jgi:hypothetical protein